MTCAPLPCELRPATAADVPKLAALYRDTALALGAWCYGLEQVAAWASFGADTPAFRDYVLGARTWVAVGEGDALLGFAGVSVHGERAEVHSLYVHPAHGRRGLGRRLLRQVLDAARAAGCCRAEAWATPFSRPLFAREGLALVQTVQAPYQGVLFERYRVAGAL